MWLRVVLRVKWQSVFLRYSLQRFALEPLVPPWHAQCVVPMVPTRAQMGDTNSFGRNIRPAKSCSEKVMRSALGIDGRRSIDNFDFQRISMGDESTLSQPFLAKSRAAHLPTHLHDSTDAAWHWSVQRPAIVIPSQASMNDLFK